MTALRTLSGTPRPTRMYLMGAFVGAAPAHRALATGKASEQTNLLLRRGFVAQDHRASRASAARRLDRGETPELCGCGAEVDVLFPAHSTRCLRQAEAA